ncbi:MAG: hypothetical protein ACFB3T_12640 [Geminicoccaceae bacterium]
MVDPVMDSPNYARAREIVQQAVDSMHSEQLDAGSALAALLLAATGIARAQFGDAAASEVFRHCVDEFDKVAKAGLRD